MLQLLIVTVLSSQNDEVSEFQQGLTEIESVFTKPATLFLRLIIGDICVTLPDVEDRLAETVRRKRVKMIILYSQSGV